MAINFSDNGCPLAPHYEKMEEIAKKMLDALSDISRNQQSTNLELSLLRSSLVIPATDTKGRVDISVMREANKNYNYITLGLITYSLLITLWFTGLKTVIDANLKGFHSEVSTPLNATSEDRPKANQ